MDNSRSILVNCQGKEKKNEEQDSYVMQDQWESINNWARGCSTKQRQGCEI